MSHAIQTNDEKVVPLDQEDTEEVPLVEEPPAMTPLPYGPLFVLCCIVLSESFSITMIFPFLAAMVKDFGIAKNDGEIGFYAGWIASAFNIAQFASSFGWGRLSDKFGRRPILMIGLFGNVLMIFLFGWSTSLWYAILARACNGFLNGNIGVAKTYLAEITDDTNAARGFSIFGFVFGFGLIVGPTIGGYLSNPHNIAPDVFPVGSLFHQFPYLLPCIASAFVALCGLLVGFFYLPETRVDAEYSCNPQSNEGAPLFSERKKSVKQGLKEMKDDEWVFIQFMKDKEVLVTTFLYAILAFYTMIFDEVFAIWATYSENGVGIGFTSYDIGTSYIIGGVTLLISQFLIFPYMVAYFGKLRLYQISAILLVLIHPCLPLSSLLIADRWKVWLSVGAVMVVRALASNFVFTVSMLLVNNSAEPAKLGAANGFAQTFCSLLRSFAPTVGGSMLAWSLTNGLPFPLDQYFCYFFISLCALITFGLTFLLTPSIENRKPPPPDEEEGSESEIGMGKIEPVMMH